MVGSRNLVLAVLVVGAFGINTRSTATPAPTTPTANTKNGSYFGLSLSTFQQDAFYGIPFAQPPVGDLRLRYPVPLNQSWTSQRNATERGLSCPGTDGTSSQGFADGLIMGEDCLTLDVIRPAGVQAGDNLPIFLWIYGGGFKAGGSADPRYNASFIVRNSVEMNQPVMVVIPNYRTMSFGVMASSEILEAGVGNIALFDQRMAMQWVAENIQGFGGDPTRVTIGGESAGGSSVGYHLVGFEGQNDGLFSGAIMESASLIGAARKSL
jgi:carboxylesterase type B